VANSCAFSTSRLQAAKTSTLSIAKGVVVPSTGAHRRTYSQGPKCHMPLTAIEARRNKLGLDRVLSYGEIRCRSKWRSNASLFCAGRLLALRKRRRIASWERFIACLVDHIPRGRRRTHSLGSGDAQATAAWSSSLHLFLRTSGQDTPWPSGWRIEEPARITRTGIIAFSAV
jgi:hypothetical protein